MLVNLITFTFGGLFAAILYKKIDNELKKEALVSETSFYNNNHKYALSQLFTVISATIVYFVLWFLMNGNIAPLFSFLVNLVQSLSGASIAVVSIIEKHYYEKHQLDGPTHKSELTHNHSFNTSLGASIAPEKSSQIIFDRIVPDSRNISKNESSGFDFSVSV